jgi:phospholipase C
MHPAFDALFPGVDLDPPSALLGGEALLAKIYDAVRCSASPTGSNAYNTLFLVTFDEHGGNYDHVPPPAALPPDPAVPAGQLGFRFDRSGVRVPAIAVSPWIAERTVINDQYRHTSVIRTLRERWQLGAPLTARDAAALSLAPVLSLDTPRDPDDWPDVTPRPVPAFSPARVPLEARLEGLCKAACFPVLALAKDMGLPAPDIDQDEAIGRADAIALIDEVFGHMFPGLHAS